MKLKVCGMKYNHNITEVAQLQPDYMGFIFYEKSSRFFNSDIPELPKFIKKVGVFVDASIDYVLEKVGTHNLEVVQLHGEESPEYCYKLSHTVPKSRKYSASQKENLEIIKVFSIKDDFDFSVLESFENSCDYYLFDTKGKLPGGNGYTFNWDVLKDYPSTKPFFLSGGIGLNKVEKLRDFKHTEALKYCYAIDVNSRFEIEAGLKDIEKLKTFKTHVTSSDF